MATGPPPETYGYFNSVWLHKNSVFSVCFFLFILCTGHCIIMLCGCIHKCTYTIIQEHTLHIMFTHSRTHTHPMVCVVRTVGILMPIVSDKRPPIQWRLYVAWYCVTKKNKFLKPDQTGSLFIWELSVTAGSQYVTEIRSSVIIHSLINTLL